MSIVQWPIVVRRHETRRDYSSVKRDSVVPATAGNCYHYAMTRPLRASSLSHLPVQLLSAFPSSFLVVFYQLPIIIPCRVFLVFPRCNVNTTGAPTQMVAVSKLPLKNPAATIEAFPNACTCLDFPVVGTRAICVPKLFVYFIFSLKRQDGV